MTELDCWSLFDAVADAVGDREAIVHRDVRRNYGALRDRCLRVASVFSAHGLGRRADRAELEEWECGQDLVGCYLLNGPEYLETTFGAYAAGVAPFNINYRYVADELVYLLDDALASVLVYHERYAPALDTVLPRLSHRPSLLLQVTDGTGHGLLDGAIDYETALQNAEPLADPDPSPDDLHVMYTGGTTGMPKGTLWRQHDLITVVLGGAAITKSLDASTLAAAAPNVDVRYLATTPFMHGFATTLSHRTLMTGGTVVLLNNVEHFDGVDVWRTVQNERITMTQAAGEAMLRPMIDALADGWYDTSSLSLVMVGAVATLPETKRRLFELLPSVMIADVAGATETGSGLSSISTRHDAGRAAVFALGEGAAVLDESRTRCLEPGSDEIGWFAKAHNLPLGYLRDEAKTRTTFSTIDGVRWAVPGDRARLLADGQAELLGRDSVTINSGGEKIFAEEVEVALLCDARVADVVVVGRPSERWGQEVVAVIACDPDASDHDLRTSAAARLARYKLPKAFVRVAAIVRSPSGKTDYTWARRVAMEAAEMEERS